MGIFQMFTDPFQLVLFLFRVPIVLLALSIHEASHGYIAYKCGDPTAKNLGRLTLNPIKHLDLVGTLCMLTFGIGWANPVPVNTRYFKNPRNGMALTAFAGPISNILLSFISIIVFTIICCVANPTSNLALMICFFFYYMHLINLMLALFNLIPIPPLDGSRIAFIFLPDKIYFGIMRYEQIIKFIFLIFIFTTGADLVSNIAYAISDGAITLLTKIPGFEASEINEALFRFYAIFTGGKSSTI